MTSIRGGDGDKRVTTNDWLLGINPIAGAAGVNLLGASSGDDFSVSRNKFTKEYIRARVSFLVRSLW